MILSRLLLDCRNLKGLSIYKGYLATLWVTSLPKRFIKDLKYLVFVSLRNESTLEQLLLKVKQKYVHYRIELRYFDQHFHLHVKLILKVDRQLVPLLEHLLQFYKPRSQLDPKVVNIL